MSTAPAAELDPSQPPLSEPARFVDAFVAPTRTFTDLLRSASWWFPFVVGIILSFAFVFSVQKHVGWDQVVHNSLAAHPAQQAKVDALPADQQQKQVEISAAFFKYIGYAYPLVILICAAIVAGVFMLTCNFGLGSRQSYSRYFALYFYATLPLALKTLLTIVLIWVGSADSFNMENPAGTNIGFYFGPGSAPAWLRTILDSADVFSIWSAVLFTIGLSIIARITRGAAAAVVFGWWGLLILFGVIGAVLRG